jgi:hypothetical protein
MRDYDKHSGHIVCLADETSLSNLSMLGELLEGNFSVSDSARRLVSDYYIIDFLTEDKSDLLLLDYELVDLRSMSTNS